MYADFASEHSPKWSSGKLPLSGGRGGIPFAGTDAKLAMGRQRARRPSERHAHKRPGAPATQRPRERRPENLRGNTRSRVFKPKRYLR